MIYRIEPHSNRPWPRGLKLPQPETREPFAGNPAHLYRNDRSGLLNAWWTGEELAPHSLPTRIEWPYDKVDDIGIAKDVSERFRNLVESIEPGRHQFVPVDFVFSSGQIVRRYWWQIRRLIDSIDHARSDESQGEYEVMVAGPTGRMIKAKERRPVFLLFDTDIIGQANFWVERTAVQRKMFCSARARDAAISEGITGAFYFGFHDDSDRF